jgi:hypothetical protein
MHVPCAGVRGLERSVRHLHDAQSEALLTGKIAQRIGDGHADAVCITSPSACAVVNMTIEQIVLRGILAHLFLAGGALEHTAAVVAV